MKWVETRSENLIAMPHGRGQVQYVRARIAARRHDHRDARAGSSATPARTRASVARSAMGPTRMMAQGVYRIPKISYECAIAFTNTTPMGAFRGAGRPEAAAMLERIIDSRPRARPRSRRAPPPQLPPARRVPVHDRDAHRVRQRRLRRRARPTRCASPATTRCRAEQAARRARGDRRALGIGVSAYVEITAGGGGAEYGTCHRARRRHGHDSRRHVGARAGSRDVVRDDRRRPARYPARPRSQFVQSDTRGRAERRRHRRFAFVAARRIGGRVGGRRRARAGARDLPRPLLEANPDDIVVMDDGRVGVAGVPASALSWAQLAQQEPLHAISDFSQEGATFPFGAHVAVVEVDLDTGHVTPIRHIAVDDCGRILNPLIVTGQQHGGIAAGNRAGVVGAVPLRRRRQPAHRDAHRLRDAERGRVPELRSVEHRDAVAAQPARREGHRRVGHDRFDARGAERGDRRAGAPRRDATSTFRARRSECGPRFATPKAGVLPDPWREPPDVFAAVDEGDSPTERADADAIDI